MYRATVENGGVTKRSQGHEGHPTWDIKHVHPDGNPVAGVVRRSTIHVYMAEPGPKKAKVQIYNPGAGNPTREIGWLEEMWVPVGAYGVASVVSLNDVDLTVYWELLPGKA